MLVKQYFDEEAPGNALNGHTDNVEAVAFSPDGKTLASAHGYDNKVRLWKVP